MINIFIVVLLTLVAQTSKASENCTMPPSDDPATLSDCSRFHWSADDFGGLQVQDHGEALWADAKGILHVARNADETPEPYRSMYRALRKQADGQYRVTDDVRAMGATNATADAASPFATQEARRRQALRGEVTGWRQELYESTRVLLEQVLHPAGDGYNPLAFAYVPGRIAYRETQGQNVAAAKERVLRARQMLMETLPARARADGAPQAWLQ